MRINNNFTDHKQKSAQTFGKITPLAKDYIKANNLFANFADPKAFSALENDASIVLDYVPKTKLFKLNWAHHTQLPSSDLINVYSKNGFEIPLMKETSNILVDLYQSMKIATMRQKSLRLENIKIKNPEQKKDYLNLKKNIIEFESKYTEEELATKEETYKFAIDSFKKSHS